MTDKANIADTPDEDPRQTEDEQYEEQLDNIPIKALLWEQNALLRAIYGELTQGKDTEDVDQYKCTKCGSITDDREQHLIDHHNGVRGMVPKHTDLFEQV